MRPTVCVIFDCNIYIDVALALGTGAKQTDLRTFEAASRPLQAEIDSFRAVISGQFGPYGLMLGSSSHIREIVKHQLSKQHGWPERKTDLFLSEFHDELVDIVLTGFVGEEHVPPLDHEDGVVFGTCHEISNREGIMQTILVTRDRQFIESMSSIPSHTTVLHPLGFMKMCEAARRFVRPI
ncbi:hypothetical protein [Bifidobacterium eulemuris]|uniref:PIN domain-containing protein n=1 Tax=Bifidobacterium eulemuris TaxID=1765219 RepID=A0A261G2J7_9BIFI|nr:hypothetical protein [Bifidobacterium eulemuris]OZG65652.1 hypothetical protein BEUL_1950 [Bifidobacterium eulemuris]QOL32419.1 hypothetical protein BE0216_08120 [Bifidobacterium eulemuris]